jgi:hypothetical protein
VSLSFSAILRTTDVSDRWAPFSFVVRADARLKTRSVITTELRITPSIVFNQSKHKKSKGGVTIGLALAFHFPFVSLILTPKFLEVASFFIKSSKLKIAQIQKRRVIR